MGNFDEQLWGISASGVILVEAAPEYHLDRVEAQAIVDRQATAIREEWIEVCDRAELTVSQRDAFLGRQFLNPHAFS